MKQLVSQSQGRKKQEDQDEVEDQDEEKRNLRAQLMTLTPEVKALVLSPRKTSINEDWAIPRGKTNMKAESDQRYIFFALK